MRLLRNPWRETDHFIRILAQRLGWGPILVVELKGWLYISGSWSTVCPLSSATDSWGKAPQLFESRPLYFHSIPSFLCVAELFWEPDCTVQGIARHDLQTTIHIPTKSISWELIKITSSQAPPQTWIRNTGVEGQQSTSRWSWYRLGFEDHVKFVMIRVTWLYKKSVFSFFFSFMFFGGLSFFYPLPFILILFFILYPLLFKKKNLFPYNGVPGSTVVKGPPASAETDACSIPGSGRSPGGGRGNPLQYFCLENSMDSGACWATVPGVAKRLTQLSILT